MAEAALATVVISTFNRKEELRTALRSAVAQDLPCEILVMDDCSSDGSAEMVEKEFPSVRLVRSERNLGLIAQRSRAAEIASTPILFSIDDDAEFSKPSVVRETLADFDDPRVGAIAIPFINVNSGPQLLQTAPDKKGLYVYSHFIGTAYALRKEIFKAAGGFADAFYRQGEELDFCVRMLDMGYYVRAGRSAPILHYESPKRDLKKIARNDPRNNILFSWRNAPWSILAFHLASTTARNLAESLKKGHLGQAFAGLWEALRLILSHRVPRRPVSWKTFRTFRALRKHSPQELA